jgi:hypothetical protein
MSDEQKKRQAEGHAESRVYRGRDHALAPQNGPPETRMLRGADIVRPITMVRSPAQPPRPAIPAEKSTRRATQQEVSRNQVTQRPSPHRQRPPTSTTASRGRKPPNAVRRRPHARHRGPPSGRRPSRWPRGGSRPKQFEPTAPLASRTWRGPQACQLSHTPAGRAPCKPLLTCT